VLIARLFRLSIAELLVLVKVAVVVVGVRAALWIQPYDRVRRHLMRERSLSKVDVPAARIVQFVSGVSRRLPGANCLTSALAAETLLRWHGFDASLRIGVSKNSSQNLVAHAWVESGGMVVIGGEEVAGLTPLRPAGAQPNS
jgi:hypothetical protein